MFFTQFNVGKRKLAWDMLCYDITHAKRKQHSIFLITEPYLLKSGRCPKLPPGYLSYGEKFSRGIIVAHRSLNLWFSPEFSGPDITTVKLISDSQSWYICSLYCDILKEVIHPTLDKLVNSLDVTGDAVIIGCDTNCHTPMIGSKNSNPRGLIFEEYVLSNNLCIHNIGNKPTFVRKGCETVIDATLSKNLKCDIVNWRVIDEFKFSDHLPIEFTLHVFREKEKNVLDFNKCNFEKFRENLPKKKEFVNFWSISAIEKEAEFIEKSILTAINKSCPVKRPTIYKSRWWSEELNCKKFEVKKLAKKAWLTKAEDDWNNLKSANKVYSKMIRKTKRQKWQQWCSQVQTPKNMAWLNKAISRKENQAISLLRYADGTFSRSPGDVVDLLLDQHFPDSSKHGDEPLLEVDDQLAAGKTCYAWEISSHFITKMKVKESFMSFGPDKACGLDGIKAKFLQNLNDNFIN